ncbi:hypothetical protein LINGRAHAP2_LOCUS7209 [Linum grandiflorum]
MVELSPLSGVNLIE